MCQKTKTPSCAQPPPWAARQLGLQGVPFPCRGTWSSARSPCSWQRPADPSRRSPPCVLPSLFLLPLSSTSALRVKPIASPLQLLRVDPELQTAGLGASWALTALTPGRAWREMSLLLELPPHVSRNSCSSPELRGHWTCCQDPLDRPDGPSSDTAAPSSCDFWIRPFTDPFNRR